ncbi:hypothetical protein bsdcttw_41470 [Anaerocolumna chitinilytica]|uniref:Uncharacterized protein n=1 Tax=Anaerocolumna chitinilytica TaxID=1727145 RepID=A0A7I8DXY4_9FIRM|nr:hypothetical protein bsdcttw_41470 [Anaerocolumna chitinilytica]
MISIVTYSSSTENNTAQGMSGLIYMFTGYLYKAERTNASLNIEPAFIILLCVIAVPIRKTELLRL